MTEKYRYGHKEVLTNTHIRTFISGEDDVALYMPHSILFV